MWQRSRNSDWLLPNRIYEASWCGCPSVALAETQTSKRIRDAGIGWVIPAPEPARLAALLDRLTPQALATARDRLLARPAADFVQSPAELLPMLAPALLRA